MPRSENKKSGINKPQRPCIQSMEIPPTSSKQPSRSTTCSSPPCSRAQSACSEILSEPPSCKDIFCTSQTCSNSENCMKTLPEFCPFGLKDDEDEEEEESQCTGSCHSGNTKNDPHDKLISISSRSNNKNESRRDNRHYPVTVPLTSAKHTSLQKMGSSCCDVKAISANQSLESLAKHPTRTQNKQSSTTKLNANSRDTKSPCCTSGADGTKQIRSLADMADTGTGTNQFPNKPEVFCKKSSSNANPKDTKMSCCAKGADAVKQSRSFGMTDPKKTEGIGKKGSSNGNPRETTMSCCAKGANTAQTRSLADMNDPGANPTQNKSEGIGKKDGTSLMSVHKKGAKCEMKCNSPDPNSSLTEIRRRSSVRTSFSVPDQQPLSKKHSMPHDSDQGLKKPSDSCSCGKTKMLPHDQKTCSCHFPPAFNQFGCSGNLSGSCNCATDD